jgi:hypothetical protein
LIALVSLVTTKQAAKTAQTFLSFTLQAPEAAGCSILSLLRELLAARDPTSKLVNTLIHLTLYLLVYTTQHTLTLLIGILLALLTILILLALLALLTVLILLALLTILILLALLTILILLALLTILILLALLAILILLALLAILILLILIVQSICSFFGISLAYHLHAN